MIQEMFISWDAQAVSMESLRADFKIPMAEEHMMPTWSSLIHKAIDYGQLIMEERGMMKLKMLALIVTVIFI